MARKSKFAIGFTTINQMSIPELKEYIKKARPYMIRKVKGLKASEFSYFSDVVQFIDTEAEKPSLYGITHDYLKGTGAKGNRNTVEAFKRLTNIPNATPRQLQKMAQMINYAATKTDQPAEMAKRYVAKADDIKRILEYWAYDDAAKMLNELMRKPKGLQTFRDFWKNYQDELFEAFNSGEDEVNIRYYVDTYGENTEEFYLELFKHINELYVK